MKKTTQAWQSQVSRRVRPTRTKILELFRLFKHALIQVFLIELVLIACFLPRIAWSQNKSASKKLSSVEMQWEENKHATKYQVQVFNSKNKFLRTFESKTSLIKFKSTSGRVKIRGRFLDSYGQYSEWSELIEVNVPPEDVDFPKPSEENPLPPITAQASNRTMKAKIDLKWQEAAQAKKYKIKVYDKNNNLVLETVTTQSTSSIQIEAGDFRFSITAIGNDNIEGKETFSPQPLVVKTAQIADIPFKLEEDEKDKNHFKVIIPDLDNVVIAGKLEYSYHLANSWMVVEELTQPSGIWSPDPKLKPGKYRITFWGKKNGWQDSNTFTHEFVIKPTEESLKEI